MKKKKPKKVMVLSVHTPKELLEVLKEVIETKKGWEVHPLQVGDDLITAAKKLRPSGVVVHANLGRCLEGVDVCAFLLERKLCSGVVVVSKTASRAQEHAVAEAGGWLLPQGADKKAVGEILAAAFEL